MIELGLARVSRLLKHSALPWRSVHVAGTNGKGSICAYVSAMLQINDVRCGRFTSPHLVDRWDCISIDGKAVNEELFREVEDTVKRRDLARAVGSTEFELTTATAFEIFTREKVQVAVVECGLGGRLDATNVLEKPLVAIISKIGLDHQSFLGNTTEEIAKEKAGIMKPGVPCVVDTTNTESVTNVLKTCAGLTGATLKMASLEADDELAWKGIQELDFEDHQRANLNCAIVALKLALKQLNKQPDVQKSIAALRDIKWPGRLQRLSIQSLTGRIDNVLLDGAHNTQSAEVLGSYVDRKVRTAGQSVTWVIAASAGKNLKEILQFLLKPGDNLVAVEFGPVDGMPWVSPATAKTILEAADSILKGSKGQRHDAKRGVLGALQWATSVGAGGPLVIAGSLYLVSDVIRLLREAGQAE
ncbi:MAG: folylpolyglutamate synthase [Trichoglossum hirsutum]|nr:MAG: folylpolyglutamate synthase [Trichoglossum hirsutum]